MLNREDFKEIEKFSSISQEWWDQDGGFRALHDMHEARMSYIVESIVSNFDLHTTSLGVPSLKGIRVLDVGCGGGLVSESLCRLGADVLGIDQGEANISVATKHASDSGLNIDYLCCGIEDLEEGRSFDIVLAMEVIEHVSGKKNFVKLCADRVDYGGIYICSTINRTLKSFLGAIVAGEYVLGWLPKGTHSWQSFVKCSEMRFFMENAGLDSCEFKGLVYHILDRRWSISDCYTAINYVAKGFKNPGRICIQSS